MLILSPNSVCDVCLDGYNKRDNAPHAITCGHIFCLSCLKSLSKPWCPLCRASFQLEDVRKIHIDKVNSVPPTPIHRPSNNMDDMDDMDDTFVEARNYLSQISTAAIEGNRPKTEVRELIQDVQQWLLTQPEDEHMDLRAASLLLWRVVNARERKDEHQQLQDQHEELQTGFERLHRMYEDQKMALATARLELSNQKARAMERERELLNDINDIRLDWSSKYELCLDDNRQLRDMLRKTRPDIILSPPKEIRKIYSDTPKIESRIIVNEDRRVSTSPPKPNRQSIFQLSPVPATLPMPSLSSIEATFRSPAEDSDAEEIRRVSPFTDRSAQPIPIKSSGHHRNHGSLLSRHDTDSIPRSIPRSLVDVQMGSCSSSPSVPDLKYSSADRHSETVSQSVTMHDSSTLSRRPTGTSRRPSISSHTSQPQDIEGQRVYWRAKLRDVLDQDHSEDEALRLRPAEPERKLPPRTISPPRSVLAPRRTTSPETKRTSSPESSAPVTRQPSPVSTTGSSYDPVSEKERLQNPLLQRPRGETISRASTAALQAEQAARERERARQEKMVSATAMAPPPSHTAAPVFKDRAPQRDISNTYYQALQPQQHPRPPIHRRPSDTLQQGKPTNSHPAVPSGLTRSLLGRETQHAQRV